MDFTNVSARVFSAFVTPGVPLKSIGFVGSYGFGPPTVVVVVGAAAVVEGAAAVAECELLPHAVRSRAIAAALTRPVRRWFVVTAAD